MSKKNANKKRASTQNRVLGLIGLFILFAFLFVWNSSLEESAQQIFSNKEQLALGEIVYTENCARCHGVEGAGHAEVDAAPALNGSEHAWHHTDGLLQEMVSSGGSIMPKFSNTLSNQEITAVIRYFQIWWPEGKLAGQQNASQSNPFIDD